MEEHKYKCWKCGCTVGLYQYKFTSGMCCEVTDEDKKKINSEIDKTGHSEEAFYNLGKANGFEIYRYWDFPETVVSDLMK